MRRDPTVTTHLNSPFRGEGEHPCNTRYQLYPKYLTWRQTHCHILLPQSRLWWGGRLMAVRRTQICLMPNVHHFPHKNIAFLMACILIPSVKFPYPFIHSAADENPTACIERAIKIQAKEQSQLQGSISVKDARCQHPNSLDRTAGRWCPHSQG